MKIPLYKLFLIQAAYAIALGSLCRFGVVGIVNGLVLGTAMSGLILLVRKDKVNSVVLVGVGCIIGGFCGLTCLTEPLVSWLYLYDHGFGESLRCAFAGGIIGVVVGGIISSLLLNWIGRS